MSTKPKTDLNRRVLVVEDDRDLAELLVEVLTYENCVPDVASNGQEALEQLRVYDYEAVICDLLMPRMNGQAFYSKVIQDHPYLAEKVLFISGELTHRSGMSEFVYQSRACSRDGPPFVSSTRSRAASRARSGPSEHFDPGLSGHTGTIAGC